MIWDVRSKNYVKNEKLVAENYYIGWNSKGDQLAASSKDGKLLFFDIKTMSVS